MNSHRRVVPLRLRRPYFILVAVDDPSDASVLEELQRITKLQPEPVVASVVELDTALGIKDLNV